LIEIVTEVLTLN